MKKVRIIKNKKTYFESYFYTSYENKKIIEIDFNDLHDADLHCTDLHNANLSGSNLSNADLCNSNLSGAYLYNANLSGAYLYNANLSGAYLNCTDLHRANLCDANLHNAYLNYTNLSHANLCVADLSHAILYHTDLNHTDLSGANLYNADLHNADLSNADLESTILNEKEAIRKGKIINKKAFIYKKCRGKIVKLELQIGSIVFSINNKKCRTNKAKVISIDGNKKKGLKIASDYDNNFIYEVGKIIEVEDFNLMYNVECGTGIHFFWTEKEAKKYFS